MRLPCSSHARPFVPHHTVVTHYHSPLTPLCISTQEPANTNTHNVHHSAQPTLPPHHPSQEHASSPSIHSHPPSSPHMISSRLHTPCTPTSASYHQCHHNHLHPHPVVIQWQRTATHILTSVIVTLASLAGVVPPSSAHIPLETSGSLTPRLPPPEANLGLTPGTIRRGSLAYSSQASGFVPGDRDLGNSSNSSGRGGQGTAVVSTASRAKVALEQLQQARAAVHGGRFDEALNDYNTVVNTYGDLALAEYARTGRALLLYQVGHTSDALLALEDQEVALRGTAEVHAALAALLWVERPSLAFRAEQQWEVAREFDSRYSDPQWVAEAKHWPPRAVDALTRFLKLER